MKKFAKDLVVGDRVVRVGNGTPRIVSSVGPFVGTHDGVEHPKFISVLFEDGGDERHVFYRYAEVTAVEEKKAEPPAKFQIVSSKWGPCGTYETIEAALKIAVPAVKEEVMEIFEVRSTLVARVTEIPSSLKVERFDI
jgi:hypothetical protein